MLNNILAKQFQSFIASSAEQSRGGIPKVFAGTYFAAADLHYLPQVFISYQQARLPVLELPVVRQEGNRLFARAGFLDRGVGELLACGFFIESEPVGAILTDGFEDGTLNGYALESTDAAADLEEIIQLDKQQTSGDHSLYAVRLKSSAKQATKLSCRLNGPFDFSFKWKVSSEPNYDTLKWFVDGEEQKAISGEVDWEEQRLSIGGGGHEISFAYSKDGAKDGGNDCGWIDDVAWGRKYTRHYAAAPVAGESFSLDITDLVGNVNYIAAFAEHSLGVVTGENLAYRITGGWEGGKLMGIAPERIHKINGVPRRKIKAVYLGAREI